MSKPESDKHQDIADPALLQNAIHHILEQIAKRDQKIAEKDALLHYARAQLKERESQLHEIASSKIWKLMLFFQRVRTFLVSPHRRRSEMLRRGWGIILSALKKTGRTE